VPFSAGDRGEVSLFVESVSCPSSARMNGERSEGCAKHSVKNKVSWNTARKERISFIGWNTLLFSFCVSSSVRGR
jgi:hypothetical protein